MKKYISWEQVLDGKAAATIEGVAVKLFYNHSSRELVLEYDDKPAKSWGTEECYGCGNEFKWSHTPGAIPTCDRCIRMMHGGD